MSDNNSPEQKKTSTSYMFPLIVFGIGLVSGFVIGHPSEAEGKNEAVFDATTISSQKVCDQDMPVVAPVLWRDNYTLAFDGRSRNPFWVQEVLTKESHAGVKKLGKCTFQADSQLPRSLRVNSEEYTMSGYEKGVMAGVGDEQLMSNTCPQCPHLMKGYWADLDKFIRGKIAQFDEIRVVTGPLYLPQTTADGKKYVKYQVIGDSDVAVPTHFYRVVFSRLGDNSTSEAYLVPNEPVPANTPIEKYKVSVEQVEKASGILFSS